MKNIGNAIKLWQKEYKVSTTEMANRLNVSIPTISQLINGRFAFGKKSAQRWAEEFGFNPAFLLTGEGELLKDFRKMDSQADIVIPSRLVNFYENLSETIKAQEKNIDRLTSIIEKQTDIISAQKNGMGSQDQKTA